MHIDDRFFTKELTHKIKELSRSSFILDLVKKHTSNNNIQRTIFFKDKLDNNNYSYTFYVNKFYVREDDEFISIVAKEILSAIPDKWSNFYSNTFTIELTYEDTCLAINVFFDHLGD